MRHLDGHYECVVCGARLDIPEDRAPLVMIVAEGGESNMRTISLDGEELHRCPVGLPANAAAPDA